MSCWKIVGVQCSWGIIYKEAEVTAELNYELDSHMGSYVQTSSCFFQSFSTIEGSHRDPESAESHVESVRLGSLAYAVGKHEALFFQMLQLFIGDLATRSVGP